MATESKLFHGQKDNPTDWIWFQKNAAMKATIDEELTKKSKKQLDKRQEDIKKSNRDIVDFEKKLRSAKTADEKKELKKQIAETIAAKKAAEKEIEKIKADIRREGNRISQIAEKNRYAAMNKREQMEYQKTVLENLKTDKKALQEKHELQLAQIATLEKKLQNAATPEEAAKIDKQLSSKRKQADKTANAISSLTSDEEKTTKLIEALFNTVGTASEKAKKAAEDYAKAEQTRAEVAAEETSKQEELQKKLKTAKTKDDKAAIQKELEASKNRIESANAEAQAALDAKNAATAAQKEFKTLEEQQNEENEKHLKRSNKIISELSKLGSMASNSVDSALAALYGVQGRMQGRLQGSGTSWKSALDVVSTNVGVSGIASQQKVVEKMVQLVDSGVAYNLELRAFLAETSENIASTFNAFDSNLLRLIRLQQSDSTAARLGMEATLTSLFNDYFEDSSYLAQDVSDAVSGAILDASATMSREDSLAFEYTVQKWLGALYSLGMSQDTVTNLARGINYIATSNVAALSDDSALQTLFGLSSNKTKKSYADMLTQGITAAETNELLKAIVTTMSKMVTESTDRVSTAAYAKLFNMSLTDLRTFSSLSSTDIDDIFDNTVTYDTLIGNTEKQLTQIWSRKHTSQIVDTIIENAMTGTAQSIGSNVITYGLWKALNLVDSLVDIEIPGITAVGTGTTSAIDILNIAKLGFVGQTTLASLMESLVSGSGGGINLSAWDAKETTSRGSSLPILPVGSAATTSYSAAMGVGGVDSSTVSDVSFETAQTTAQENSGITSEELQESKEIPQKIFDAIAGDSTPTVLSLLQEIDDRLDPGRVFYTAIAGVLSSDVVSNVTNLSTQLAVARTISTTDESVSPESKTETAANTTSGISGLSELWESNDTLPIETIIAAAVEEGIRAFANVYTMPVELKNIPGGFV